MELTRTVAEWRSRPREQWLAELNRILPPVAAILLVIFLAFKGADLTWRLLGQPAVQDELPPVVLVSGGGASPAPSGNLSPLRNWEPFGTAPAPVEGQMIPAGDVLNAEETRLQLLLHGRVTKHSLPEPGTMILVPESGWASISSGRAAPKYYGPGELIDGTNGYTLHSVYPDRVLIQPPGGGPLERLSLPDLDQLGQSSARLNTSLPTRTTTVPFRAEAVSNTTAAVAVADAAVAAASTTFAQHIQLRMHEGQGQMIGFRLEPRNDSPVLSQLGLQPGDVLTEVNGTRLNDLRNTASVLQALSETAQASVVIRRNGVDQAMVINVGDIQRLAESLQ